MSVVIDCDVDTILREACGDGLTDALTTAGDDGDGIHKLQLVAARIEMEERKVEIKNRQAKEGKKRHRAGNPREAKPRIIGYLV